jgi:uncharacterized damage-inducible protein DinB
MTARQILLDQFAACHDTNGWFVAMDGALSGLTSRQAAWRGDPSGHSVWQILTHVTFWNDRYLRRFRDLPVEQVGENAATFDAQPPSGNEEAWSAARARFDEVMKEWKKTIAEAHEKKLDGPVGSDSPETWYAKLSHIALHTAHHIGQIVTIRKTQGSWDPKQGVS